MSFYDITYKTIGHTYPVISTEADMGEYSPPKKWVQLERNLSLTLTIITPERSLETHKRFHPENN